MNPTVLSLITFAGLASTAGALLLGARDLLLPRRERSLTLRNAFHSAAAERGTEEPGLLARLDRWFDRTLYLARPGMDALTATVVFLLVAVACGGTVFVATDLIPLSIATAITGMAVTLGGIVIAAKRRLKMFQTQFPSALDLLARAVRAGESLENGIELVADAVKDPVATEFRLCAQQLKMGLSMSAAMSSLVDRIGLMDVRIFGSTLSLHRQSGGNVALTVERMSVVIRDRMEYHRQLKSVTGAGRLSVLLVLALGPILFANLFLFQPEYGQNLWTDPVGRWTLGLAAASQLVGVIWVARVLKKDY